MSFPSRLKKILPALALLALCQEATAWDVSAWSEGHRSRVRLVAGGTDGGHPLAGVEIALDPGFKTYWRNPGESGLPPSFDWSKSTNVEAVEVMWPAPARLEDAAGVSYGYLRQVVFPVRVRRREPRKAVTLALTIHYGVCKEICIPAQAELSLTLPKHGAPPAQAVIEQALAWVPRQQPAGASGDLSLVGAEPTMVDGKPSLRVSVRAPTGSRPRLFAEAPDDWFLLPAAAPIAIGTGPDAEQAFLVEILDRPRDTTGPVELRFTVVTDAKAIETPVRLDAAQLPR
jgi:DsbC/DsbD-like thiol-disulfide interchange protein